MAAHTPGPWLRDGSLVYRTREHNGQQVNCFSAHVDSYCSQGGTIGEHQANIRLIAAAPDLLDALKLVSTLQGFEPKEPYGIVVLAAIAKAEGR